MKNTQKSVRERERESDRDRDRKNEIRVRKRDKDGAKRKNNNKDKNSSFLFCFYLGARGSSESVLFVIGNPDKRTLASVSIVCLCVTLPNTT